MIFSDNRLPLRFWNKTSPCPASGCWLWVGAVNSAGYGKIQLGGRLVHSHRAAYTAANGDIKPGLQIDHLCRVRSCCNPLHLEAVSASENVRRGHIARRKTHCKRGHELSGGNVRVRPNARFCRACDVIRQRESQNRRKP
jgi:hypothetical protein